MKSPRLPRSLARIASVGLSAAVLVAMVAPPASAAPAPLSSANAAHGSVLTTTLSTGVCDFPADSNTACSTPGLGNTTALLAASVLTQTANGDATGDFACGGVAGSGGGLIQVGPAGPCPSLASVENDTAIGAGVVVLGGLVTADVAYATCVGTTDGVTGGSVVLGIPGLLGSGADSLGTLLGVSLTNLLGLLGTVTVTGTPSPGTAPSVVTVNLLPLLGTSTPLLRLALNQTTVNGTSTTYTAFDLQVLPGFINLENSVPALGSLLGNLLSALGGGLTFSGITGTTPAIELTAGVATCSTVPVTPPTDLVPLAGTPIAAGMLLIAGYLGYRFWWTPRRRNESVTL